MIVSALGRDFPVKIWDGETLEPLIGIDTETTLIVDDRWFDVPDLVTLQAADKNAAFYVREEDIARFFEVQEKTSPTYIAHNAPFDVDVICKFLKDNNYFCKILEQSRLIDTQMLWKLVHLAENGYTPKLTSLAYICEQFLNFKLDKNEDIRLNFAQFKGQSIEDIPEDFLTYGSLDAIVLPFLYDILRTRSFKVGSETLLSHGIQVLGNIALQRIYKRGIGFNLDKSEVFLKKLDEIMSDKWTIMRDFGYVPGQKGNTQAFDYIVGTYLNLDLPKTKNGSYSSKREDLEEVADMDFIPAYLEYQDAKKLSDFAINNKENIVHPQYNPLVNTGRTSSRKPNFQNLPRTGGVREMFIPRHKDNIFVITDYSAIELATLAQNCLDRFGFSVMADRINAGEDLHRFYAGQLFNKPAKDVTKSERQYAKASNFGFPGGLGTETFIKYAYKTYGVRVTQEEAKRMKEIWFEAFPEAALWLGKPKGKAFTRTGRIRGKVTFCAEKNTPFQGLAADGAKIALYQCDKAGLQTVGFVHDEIIIECNRMEVHEKRLQLEDLMIKSMKMVVPDVKITVESTISDHYCK